MRVEEADTPQPDLVDRLLRLLPAWFGIESSIVEYVEAAQRLATLVARADDGTAVGVLLHERHFPETAEIHLMAVDPAWHRRGAGRALVAELERIVRADGAQLLTVKTLGPSHPDEGYRATRRFYEACGFLPVEELLELWPGNPCLVMLKPLAGQRAGSAAGPRVLVLGLDPFHVPGDWDPQPVADAIEAGRARFVAEGLPARFCLFGTDGSVDIDAVVTDALTVYEWDCVVIGGGVRHDDVLFERVLNLVHRHAPRAAIAFNDTAATTYEAAVRRLRH